MGQESDEAATAAVRTDLGRAVFAVFLVALGVAFLYDALRLSSEYTNGVGPAAIPSVMSVALILLGGAYGLAGARAHRHRHRATPSELAEAPCSTGERSAARVKAERSLGGGLSRARSSPVTYMLLSGVFIYLVPLVGFFVSLTLFLIATCVCVNIRPWWKTPLVVGGLDLFCYFAFTVALGIYFPSGMFV